MKPSSKLIKTLVKEGYTQAVSQTCGCSGHSRPGMKGQLVQIAGYSVQELKNLPDDSVANAFGCGNPTAAAGVMPGQTVVDIGSGAGIDCLLAAEKTGKGGRVIGIDMTPVMVEKATANAKRAGAENVEFRLGDAEQMPVDSATADWIISNCVINLAPDKDKVFKEIFRVLKPDGRVSISDIVLGADLPEAVAHDFQALVGCIAGAIKESEYVEKMYAAGLRDIFIVDRLIYNRSQIGSLMSEEGCCGSGISPEVRSVLPLLEGKIWSARIIARKPDTPGTDFELLRIRKAEPPDILFIKALLAESALPVEDIDPHLKHFYVALSGAHIAGVAGAEVYLPYALMRSVAVRPAFRKHGIARRLIESVLTRLKHDGVSEVFLLTKDAALYFSNMGFKIISRKDVPENIKNCSQFSECCCNGATVMTCRL